MVNQSPFASLICKIYTNAVLYKYLSITIASLKHDYTEDWLFLHMRQVHIKQLLKLDAGRERNKESHARTGSSKSGKSDPSPYFFIWNVTRFWSSPVNDRRNPAAHYSRSWLCTASGSSPVSDKGNSLRYVFSLPIHLTLRARMNVCFRNLITITISFLFLALPSKQVNAVLIALIDVFFFHLQKGT